MDLKELEQIDANEFRHWYYRSKFLALKKMIDNIQADEILDVGAGSGIFSKMMLMDNSCQSACCLDTGYTFNKIDFINGHQIQYLNKIDLINQTLVLFVDVLEHIDDDTAFLREYVEKMPAGCHVLISVPAFMFLWSRHDVFLNHQRRYTRAQLEKVVRAAGLDIMDTRFFFGLIFPIAACMRIFSRMRKNDAVKSDLVSVPSWLNIFLTGIHVLETETLFRINKLCGLSVFCLAKKPT